MYVFIPEHFYVANSDEVKVLARTCFCRGVRFLATQGQWTTVETHSCYSHPGRMHWLHILFVNTKYKSTSGDVPNALVFRENDNIIFEITQPIGYGTYIRATFYDISLDDIIAITDYNNNPNSISAITTRTNLSALFMNVLATSEPVDLSVANLKPSPVACVDPTKLTLRKKRMLPCDACGKQFDRPSLLKRHIRTHTGERPHICEVCGKGFSTSSSLNTHKRIHSGERPHQCVLCGKRFTASSNLYYHRLTHSSEKPHKCDVCGKSFPTPGNLRSHKYSHGTSSPYKCTICLRAFTKLINLKNHKNLQKH